MILKLVRWGSRAVVIPIIFIFIRDQAVEGEQVASGWRTALGVLLVAAIVVAVVTFDPVLKLLSRGPKLIGGDFVEYTRNAIAGSDLQVFGVEIYNERESGGEGKTARDVVPSIEAYTLDGQRRYRQSRGLVSGWNRQHPADGHL